jgi:prolyl-tRNA synthetase
MFVSYLRTFARLGLKAIPMEAETGPIGGDLSHEFIVLADTGESEVFCDREVLDIDVPGADIDYDDDAALAAVIDRFTQQYARTEDKHVAEDFESQVPAERRYQGRGIEVGQVFYFGTKYSEPLGAQVLDASGASVAVEMGSYGVGVSRLAGAIIEASHDEAGIVWPDAVAPFDVALINLRAGDDDCTAACDGAYGALTECGLDVLYDDRDERPGSKFADADLVGLPWRVVIGPRGVKAGTVELKRRDGSIDEELPLDAAISRITTRITATNE